MKSSLLLLSFIKIQEGGLNFAISLDQLTWNDPIVFSRTIFCWTPNWKMALKNI